MMSNFIGWTGTACREATENPEEFFGFLFVAALIVFLA
jgi:hypothetical protein